VFGRKEENPKKIFDAIIFLWIVPVFYECSAK
jgi:hypothetical protein